MGTTLYYSPGTASLVVHWLLIELDIPHALHELDFDKREQKSPGYLTINPAGVVPALAMDGQIITESVAILMHLADLHSQARLAPLSGTPQRAHYYQWMVFLANTLQPAFRAWFYPAEPAGEDNVEAVRQQARLHIEGAWMRIADQLTTHGGDYLLGEQLSVADFMLTMLMRWSRNMPVPSDDWSVLRVYARRMKARPAFKETCRREGLTDWV